MNKLKFFNSYKYWVFVIFMAMTGQTNAQPASAFITSSPKYKTLIVEKIYPFSIKEYVPAVNVTQISEATENTSPEEVVFALIASMKEAKYDWNNSLWTLDSRTQMKSRENAAGQTKEYWENLWGGQKHSAHRLISKIEYGRYVLIKYEFVIDPVSGRKTRDTIALEMQNKKWFLTQALANEPILSSWNSPSGRTQSVPDSLISK